ncbi:2Fe-2S iron-sulfur cluster binding domain-containing protein, partial [bacterium]|nr:2Fe-2S iron-sulfur cluster binding domain-containing protein [bacterium]
MERTFKIFRYDPEKNGKPYFQTYRIECPTGHTVLDALYDIKGEQDGTLSYRRSCRSGICGSCGMKINGINRLACKTQVEFLKGRVIHVEPLPGFPVIRDLVIDLEPFWEKLEA